jgi:hypothetical protein
MDQVFLRLSWKWFAKDGSSPLLPSYTLFGQTACSQVSFLVHMSERCRAEELVEVIRYLRG